MQASPRQGLFVPVSLPSHSYLNVCSNSKPSGNANVVDFGAHQCDEQRPKCIICTLSERDCSYPPQGAAPASTPATTPAAPAPAVPAPPDAPTSFAATTPASNPGSASPVAGVPLPDIARRGTKPSPDGDAG